MIQKPDTFRTLIARMGGPASFGAKIGVGEWTAIGMKRRNSVNPTHWAKLLEAAKEDGMLLTTDDLVNMRLARSSKQETAA